MSSSVDAAMTAAASTKPVQTASLGVQLKPIEECRKETQDAISIVAQTVYLEAVKKQHAEPWAGVWSVPMLVPEQWWKIYSGTCSEMLFGMVPAGYDYDLATPTNYHAKRLPFPYTLASGDIVLKTIVFTIRPITTD